jgi:hypothetical protein
MSLVKRHRVINPIPLSQFPRSPVKINFQSCWDGFPHISQNTPQSWFAGRYPVVLIIMVTSNRFGFIDSMSRRPSTPDYMHEQKQNNPEKDT